MIEKKRSRKNESTRIKATQLECRDAGQWPFAASVTEMAMQSGPAFFSL